MKRIILSLSMIVFVGAIVVGATGAFFSDTETSTGNTFTAGAIDLGIDNQSYYNGEYNDGTSWSLTFDLDDQNGPYLFFDFDDLKPGDWGEDTISIHVNDNDSWACADVTLRSDDDNSVTEPELDLGDNDDEGELDEEVYWYWWADDGDNVYEDDESLIHSGVTFGQVPVDFTSTVALADSNGNIWDDPQYTLGEDDSLGGGVTYYIGKFWCFGQASPNPVQEGAGINPTVNSGFSCDGASTSNLSQSDSFSLDVSFRAVQHRNNLGFVCESPTT